MALFLPLILPREELRSLPLHRPPSSHDWSNFTNTPSNPTLSLSSRRDARAATLRSPLALLNADENAIAQRKTNIQRFGASWIRPPGVAKTLQQLTDEAIERAEQEEMARREAQMMELAAAEQAEAEGPAGGTEEQDQIMEERDLDADVPDADETDLDAEIPEADGTFNEESLIEHSDMPQEDDAEEPDPLMSQHLIEMEEAVLAGRVQAQEDLGIERDLDDDIPDAGSYEHTDTEAEIESSEDEDMQQSAARASLGPVRESTNRFRRSMVSEDGEVAGSSFMESSPVLQRGASSGNAWRSRTTRLRGRRYVS